MSSDATIAPSEGVRQVEITLNPQGVAEPAQKAALTVSHVVVAALNAFAEGELDEPEYVGPGISYRFSGPPQTSDERRIAYQNWLLSKGFQDLTRGIRETLEEAHLYITVCGWTPRRTTPEQFDLDVAEVRDTANKRNFVQLLALVNAKLTEALAFEREFLSLQKVRNCLEHRAGIVGPKDAENGSLLLTFPRIAVFISDGEQERELPRDAPFHDQPIAAGRVISFRRATYERRYRLGERVIFTPTDFQEIALACHLFAADLAAKLPQPS